LLLREIRGLDGANRTKYLNFTESTQKDRIVEIEKLCVTPLDDNAVWREHIKAIFNYLNSQEEKFRLVINVYSPRSVFDSLCRVSINEEYEYLPVYLIFVDFLETNRLWVFNGKLSWTRTKIDLPKHILFLTDNSDTFMNKFIDCILGMFDDEILDQWNLRYENLLDIFEDGRLVNEGTVHFSKNQPKIEKSQNKSIFEWLQHNSALRQILAQRFSANIIN
jgi:hypothetical protein